MRNAHRTAQPALTAKQPQTRAAWLHAAVTAPVHTPHRVVFLSKGESQPMESTVAVGRGRQPHTAQGWVERCPAGGLLLSTRICAERSSEHHTQLKYPPQSDEQRGCVTKGKTVNPKEPKFPDRKCNLKCTRSPHPAEPQSLCPPPPNNPSTHRQLPSPRSCMGSPPWGWRAGWEGCCVGSFFPSAHCPGAELSLLTLKQELKKLILQNLAKKITTANIKKKQLWLQRRCLQAALTWNTPTAPCCSTHCW